MDDAATPSVHRLGFWSASLAAAFSLAYVVGQLAEWAGLLGSAGGPESASTPLGIGVLLTPSLLLALTFPVVVVCVHSFAPPGRRVWSHVAVVFASMYAVCVGLTYYVQLTFVMPHLLAGDAGGLRVAPFRFVPFDSFLYSVDLLGYSLMSLSTLFAAFALAGPGLERTARRFLLANGLLLPFLALQIYHHALIWPASLWAVTFPGAMIALGLLFRRERRRVTGRTSVPA